MSFLTLLNQVSPTCQLWTHTSYQISGHPIRNKVHNKSNVLESSRSQPPYPSLWKKLSPMKPVPGTKKAGNCCPDAFKSDTRGSVLKSPSSRVSKVNGDSGSAVKCPVSVLKESFFWLTRYQWPINSTFLKVKGPNSWESYRGAPSRPVHGTWMGEGTSGWKYKVSQYLEEEKKIRCFSCWSQYVKTHFIF